MKVISFCIFGNKQKYRRGLLENISIIKRDLSDYNIFLTVGNDIETEFINLINKDNINLIYSDKTGYQIMNDRLLIFDKDEIQILFSRDVDSRITKRDIWCIREFEHSNKNYIHIIRDHKDHDQYIMGGMCGFKKINKRFPMKLQLVFDNFVKTLNDKDDLHKYGIDQLFLQIIYKTNLQKLVHSKHVVYGFEKVIEIPMNHIDQFDFIGNVIDFDNDDKPFYLYTIK